MFRFRHSGIDKLPYNSVGCRVQNNAFGLRLESKAMIRRKVQMQVKIAVVCFGLDISRVPKQTCRTADDFLHDCSASQNSISGEGWS